MATFKHDCLHRCFQNWITQQRQDLEELLHALTSDSNDDVKLHLLAQKSIKHFQDYHDTRAQLAQHDSLSFFSPSWCTSFENSFLWIGGCRPSLSIRLVYSLCGSELEAQLTEFLQGETKGNLGDLSARQLNLINALHCKTVKEEEKLSTRLASLQEDIADEPLVMVPTESGQDVGRVMDAHALSLARLLADGDKLRLSTWKELIDILTPLQAVDLLVASKKLHLSMHEWGKLRDHHMGKVA